MQLWDPETGNVLAGPFGGHTEGPDFIAFSPDGRRIVSGSFDKAIRVWELEPETVLDGWENYPHFKEGWITDASSNHILWVPPWLREGLYLPRTSLVIRSGGTTKLDLTHFVHGTAWQKCIDPKLQN
ncbi:hypothetical protein B0H13DRAFT_1976067, partial [Mycena leptocephala]